MTRPQNDFMDYQLGVKHDVLDHGYIKVLDYMGTERCLAYAARQSYGDGTKTVNDDAGLIRYLLRHWHTSPIEMGEIKIEVKLPIFVIRQWIRHRTANVNEYSGRYSKMIEEFYFPERNRIMGQSKTNKQGSDGYVGDATANDFLDDLERDCATSLIHYKMALNEKDDKENYDSKTIGIARETARIGLPVNQYTKMVWKVDVHNLLHFLMLRTNPKAQWEIQQYANVLCDIVKGWMPNLWDAFEDYRLNAVTLSGRQIEYFKSFLVGATDGYSRDLMEDFYNGINGNNMGWSKGEIRETLEKFERLVG